MNARQPIHSFVSYEWKEQGSQPARLISRAPAMCKPAASSLPAAADLPDPSGNPVPSDMNGHLLVDILTLAFVVGAAVLFLVIKTWLRRKAAAAKSAAEAAAAEAAALSVKTEGTMTDSDLFNIDESLNRVYKELSSHQSRLDSMEQLAAWRLELVNFNRILSLLPKPVLPSQENGDVDQEADNHQADNWGEEARLQYPAV